MDKPIILILAVGLSVVTVLADTLIKKATEIKSGTVMFSLVLTAALIYAFTALGWYKVLQKFELLNTGVIYALSCIILISLVSVFYFKEKLLVAEAVGLTLAVASIILLYRFH